MDRFHWTVIVGFASIVALIYASQSGSEAMSICSVKHSRDVCVQQLR